MEMIGKVAEVVKGIADSIKAQIDYIFNSPSVRGCVRQSESFGYGSREFRFYERFLDTVIPVIKQEVESEMKASQKRVSKYTSLSRNDIIKGLKGADQK